MNPAYIPFIIGSLILVALVAIGMAWSVVKDIAKQLRNNDYD